MAQWQITISQPTSPTPSPALGTLTLARWAGEPPSRDNLRHIRAGSLTAANVVTIDGSTLTRLWHGTWQIAVLCTEAELDLYNQLLDWQDQQYAVGNDGSLVLTDEITYLPPEPSGYNSRPYVSGSAVTVASGRVKGYGQFRVKVSEAKAPIYGYSLANGNMHLLQLVAVEV